MSALSTVTSEAGIPQEIIDAIRPIFAAAVWRWFDANRDRALFTKKILFFSFTITVRDFEGVIGEIAGPRPGG